MPSIERHPTRGRNEGPAAVGCLRRILLAMLAMPVAFLVLNSVIRITMGPGAEWSEADVIQITHDDDDLLILISVHLMQRRHGLLISHPNLAIDITHHLIRVSKDEAIQQIAIESIAGTSPHSSRYLGMLEYNGSPYIIDYTDKAQPYAWNHSKARFDKVEDPRKLLQEIRAALGEGALMWLSQTGRLFEQHGTMSRIDGTFSWRGREYRVSKENDSVILRCLGRDRAQPERKNQSILLKSGIVFRYE